MALVRVGAVNINVLQWGVGEPLLLLHGLGGDSRLWTAQVESFSPHYRVIAVDLLGFGGSDKPRDPAVYTVASLTEDVARLVNALGLSGLHVVGTSMGGFIAQTLALTHPDLCRSLVLAHTAACMSIPADILAARIEALGKLSMDEYAQILVSQALGPASVERLRGELSHIIGGNDKWIYTQVLTKGLADFDLRNEVGSIDVPTLVLVGDSDRVIPPETGHDLAARIPGARLVSIDNAGHLSYLEQPDAFNRAVLDFLAAV